MNSFKSWYMNTDAWKAWLFTFVAIVAGVSFCLFTPLWILVPGIVLLVAGFVSALIVSGVRDSY